MILRSKLFQVPTRRKHSTKTIPVRDFPSDKQPYTGDLLILLQSLRNGSIISFGIQVNLDTGFDWIVHAQQLQCNRAADCGRVVVDSQTSQQTVVRTPSTPLQQPRLLRATAKPNIRILAGR